MDFYAFPVKTGDSFLLKDNEYNLLVDGGDGSLSILSEIQKNSLLPNQLLDVVLCTHYDHDHISGLLDLFDQLLFEYHYKKEPSIRIKEIWLPDIFPRIEKTKCLQARYIIVSKEEKKRESIKFKSEEHSERSFENKDFDIPIYRICRLVRLCYQLQRLHIIDNIRFLELTSSYWGKIINHKIYGINCREINRRIAPYSGEKEIILNFTRINKESLIIRYNDLTLPNILFTADSDFNFSNPSITFNSDKTIVTAPHHGSNDAAHKKVYRYLAGPNFIFVRSSEFKKSRPCPEFKLHPKNMRFCTRCNYKNPTNDQLVHLTYSFLTNSWESNSSTTICTC